MYLTVPSLTPPLQITHQTAYKILVCSYYRGHVSILSPHILFLGFFYMEEHLIGSSYTFCLKWDSSVTAVFVDQASGKNQRRVPHGPNVNSVKFNRSVLGVRGSLFCFLTFGTRFVTFIIFVSMLKLSLFLFLHENIQP